jgi:Domain of unknown function (DUF4157)
MKWNMRTFTQKENQPQKRVSSNLTGSKTATLKPHHREDPILHLHRAIGNQAVQRMLQTNAQELEVGLTGAASPRFGRDFSRVSIRPPASGAIQTKLAINAYAYTVANKVVLGAGRYAPERPDGKRLLAHELTHVMQQSASSAPRIQDQERTGTYGIQPPDAMFAGNAPAEALIPAASHMVLRQPKGGEESTKQTAEEKEKQARAKLLTEFTAGAELPEQQVSRIASAMRAFSLHQLQAMRQAGVRFWAPDSLPPEFKDKVQVENVSTPG